jgi:integrase/recombinase XerC
MPSFHQREKNGRYYCEIYDPSQDPARLWRTLRTTDKSVARQKIARWERLVALGEWDPWTDKHPSSAGDAERLPLREARARYMRSCKRRHMAASTLKLKRRTLARFVAASGPERAASDVQADDVRAFLDETEGRGGGRPSPHTLRGYASVVRAFYNWLAREGYAADNPAEGVDLPRVPPPQREALRPAELEQIIAAVQADLETDPALSRRAYLIDAFRFYAATGLRKKELPALPLAHVHLQGTGGHIEVKAFEDQRTGFSFTPKWNEDRRVELYPRAAAILRRQCGDRLAQVERGNRSPWAPIFEGVMRERLSARVVARRFSEYAERALPGRGVSLHWLRHTFATWITNDMRWPLRVAQETLGHQDIDTTAGYLHATEDAPRQAIAAGLQAAGIDYEGKTPEGAKEVGEWLTRTRSTEDQEVVEAN